MTRDGLGRPCEFRQSRFELWPDQGGVCPWGTLVLPSMNCSCAVLCSILEYCILKLNHSSFLCFILMIHVYNSMHPLLLAAIIGISSH